MKCVSREHCPQRDERVEIKEEIHRIIPDLPEICTDSADYAEPKEKGEEKELAYSSGCDNSHIQLTEAETGLSDI
jgi:hypothetical protein